MDQVVRRARELTDYAKQLGVRLLVDAEQTYFQPAIRHIAVNILMPKYNLDTPTVYSTIQCYLRVSAGSSHRLIFNMTTNDEEILHSKHILILVSTVSSMCTKI